MGRAGHKNRVRAEYIEASRRATETKERMVAQARADAEHRATDPVELAKTFLRRWGYVVFAQAVLKGGARGVTVVDRQVLDDKDVLAFARRKGFEAKDIKE